MPINEIPANQLKGTGLRPTENAEEIELQQKKPFTQNSNQELSTENTNKNVLTRKVSKISDINNTDDFASWVDGQHQKSYKKTQKKIKPINIIKSKLMDINAIPMEISILIAVLAIGAGIGLG